VKYTVQHDLEYNGRIFRRGEPIELAGSDAANYLAAGRVARLTTKKTKAPKRAAKPVTAGEEG